MDNARQDWRQMPVQTGLPGPRTQGLPRKLPPILCSVVFQAVSSGNRGCITYLHRLSMRRRTVADMRSMPAVGKLACPLTSRDLKPPDMPCIGVLRKVSAI